MPPSTASGPRMPLRRCWRFEKLLRSPRSGARSNHGSATIGTSTGWYQLFESKVTTAAHWVRVTTPVPVDGSALGWLVILRTSSLLAVVPKIASILKRALDVLSLKSCPSRKPSSSQLVPSVRVSVPAVASKATEPV